MSVICLSNQSEILDPTIQSPL